MITDDPSNNVYCDFGSVFFQSEDMICCRVLIEEVYECLGTFYNNRYLTDNLLDRESRIEHTPPFLPKLVVGSNYHFLTYK